MHAISSYRGNRPTNTHTHKQTNKQDRLQYTAPHNFLGGGNEAMMADDGRRSDATVPKLINNIKDVVTGRK